MEINLFDVFLEPNRRVYWVFILSSVVIILFVGKKLFTKRFLMHQSTRFDALYFVVMLFMIPALILPLLPDLKLISWSVMQFLERNFGFVQVVSWNRFEIALA